MQKCNVCYFFLHIQTKETLAELNTHNGFNCVLVCLTGNSYMKNGKQLYERRKITEETRKIVRSVIKSVEMNESGTIWKAHHTMF